MQSIKDFLPNIITESFKSDFLRDIYQQFKTDNRFQKIANNRNPQLLFNELIKKASLTLPIQWDKIPNENFKEYEPEEFDIAKKELSKIFKLKANKLAFIYSIKNPSKIAYIFSGKNGIIIDISGDKEYNNRGDEMRLCDILELCQDRKIVIMDYTGTLDVLDIRQQRYNTQSGRVLHGDETYNKKVALENIKRYLKVLNSSRAKKIDSELIKEIDTINNTLFKLIGKTAADNENFRNLLTLLDYNQSLMSSLKLYLEYKESIVSHYDSYYIDSIKSKERLDSHEQTVKDIINKIKKGLELAFNIDIYN